jgi:DedD protein
MMDQGAVRNLEQIQENDDQPRTPRIVSVALVVLCGACVTFGALALKGRTAAPQTAKVDPLGDLVAAHKGAAAGAAAKATDLQPKDVTFPAMLSDDQSPTTALAAVKGGQKPAPASAANAAPTIAASIAAAMPPSTPDTVSIAQVVVPPPPPTDRLPVVPLPAQNVLEASPIVTRPRDTLTRAATDQGQITTAAAPSAPSGHEGGYQLQVSSFRTQAEANQFADQLRARSHKAYVVEAHVAGRGTWYRVRVGPFPTKQAAAAYRSSFETREHVVPFIVLPQGVAPEHDH